MTYKFEEEINMIENCPPGIASELPLEAYGFVHENIADYRNFLCVAKLNPKRMHDPKMSAPGPRCSAFAISLFITQNHAAKQFQKLTLSNRNIAKSIGGHLAKVQIGADDGKVSIPDSIGHFDLWESEHCCFVGRCEIVGDLTE